MGLVIHPLHVGTVIRDKSTFTYLRNCGKLIELPLIAWYLEGASASILVDTGAPPPSECPPAVQPYVQPPEQSIRSALARCGLQPEQVEIVILTHLHWDHCTNASLFPKARFLVQRAELSYAAAPLPVHYGLYGSPGTRAFLPSGSTVDVVEGDRAVVPGISVALLPGHTPGLQGVRVETDQGVYLIASDNIPLYDNWEGEPPLLRHLPSSLHVDLESYFASFRRMEELADFVLPSHDFRVLEKGTLGK